jgi:ribose-phosphate pyrophosphokinase
MREPLVVALPADAAFAERLAAAADAEFSDVETHEFPDGETCVRLTTDCSLRDVAIVCTLHRPNGLALPILFLADAARRAGASRVGLVAPYLAYMRQDAEFHPGEAVTSRSFAAFLSRGIDWLVTVDPHLHRIGRLSDIYDIPAIALHASSEIGEWIAAHVLSPVVIGPDRESAQWARGIAETAGAPWLVADKLRRGDARVEVTVPGLARFRDSTPVLVDDIISTGRTMMAAATHLTRSLSRQPVCVGVHGIFAHGAYDGLLAAGAARVVTTNTIPHPSNAIDVVPLLARALRDEPALGRSAADAR